MENKGRPRIAYLDNIRWTVIAMVVLIHACATYSGIGDWYYNESGNAGPLEMLLFLLYESLSQAFFMGILFFIAAFLTPAAYDRKGPGRFILDRLLRLGAPTLIYMLILDPLTNIIKAAGLGQPIPLPEIGRLYLAYITSGDVLSGTGPLWFALALLAFSVAYALARAVIEAIRGKARGPRPAKPRSTKVLNAWACALMAIIGLGSFFVRLVQPFGTSWLNMQLCFFTQYIVLFCAGLWAARSGFLEWLSAASGRFWLALSLLIGVPAWFLLMGFGGVLSGNFSELAGGWHWQAAGFALWEGFFCVSFSIGLLALYRERANVRGRTSALLSDTCFGVYCFFWARYLRR